MKLEALMLSESQIKNHHGSWSNWSWLLYCCIHTVIKNIFQNDDHLRKTEDDMKSAFSFFFTQEVMRPEVSIKSNNKQTKLKTKKAKKTTYSKFKKAKNAICSKILCRFHVYEMKKTSSKIVEGECYLMDDCIDQNGILCFTGSFCCDHCCIPVHEKCVSGSGSVRNDNLFCCHECMTEDVEFDQEGYFKCVKNSLHIKIVSGCVV